MLNQRLITLLAFHCQLFVDLSFPSGVNPLLFPALIGFAFMVFAYKWFCFLSQQVWFAMFLLQKIMYFITLVLENLALSSDNNEDLIYCLKVLISQCCSNHIFLLFRN